MQHPACRAGNTAVVTGAAQGIGRAISQRLGARGIGVAMLDVDADKLIEAAAGIGPAALPIPCDVSDAAALEAARTQIEARFEAAPAILVNNAVTRMGRGFDAPLAEWHRSLDINIMGVVNGVRTFLPGMVASKAPGMIVNVGSKQGITNPPGHPVYNMAKAAIRSYTEGLEHHLRADPERLITAHLLVPGWTTTGDAEHKPGAWLPEQVADRMLGAVATGDFYIICPDGEVTEAMDRDRILWSAMDITQNRMPLSRWHDDGRAMFEAWEAWVATGRDDSDA